jgi:hypothetical protein
VAALATGAMVTLTLLTAVVGAIIVVGRAVRRFRDARRRRVAAPTRRLLLALTAGDDDAELPDRLAALDAATWRAAEPTAVAMLGKVRGDGHAALVSLLERRGMADRAVQDLRHRGPVRRARAAEVLGTFELSMTGTGFPRARLPAPPPRPSFRAHGHRRPAAPADSPELKHARLPILARSVDACALKISAKRPVCG